MLPVILISIFITYWPQWSNRRPLFTQTSDKTYGTYLKDINNIFFQIGPCQMKEYISLVIENENNFDFEARTQWK